MGKSFEVCDSFILDAKLNLLLCKINDEYFGGNSLLLKRKKILTQILSKKKKKEILQLFLIIGKIYAVTCISSLYDCLEIEYKLSKRKKLTMNATKWEVKCCVSVEEMKTVNIVLQGPMMGMLAYFMHMIFQLQFGNLMHDYHRKQKVKRSDNVTYGLYNRWS